MFHDYHDYEYILYFYHDFQVPVLISRRFPSNGQGTCNFCPSCRRRRDKEKVLILEYEYRAKLTCKVHRFHKRDQNSRDEIKVMEHHLVFCCSFAVTYLVHLPWAQRYASDCFKENMRQAIQRWQGWIKTNGWRLISSANICLYKRTSIYTAFYRISRSKVPANLCIRWPGTVLHSGKTGDLYEVAPEWFFLHLNCCIILHDFVCPRYNDTCIMFHFGPIVNRQFTNVV